MIEEFVKRKVLGLGLPKKPSFVVFFESRYASQVSVSEDGITSYCTSRSKDS